VAGVHCVAAVAASAPVHQATVMREASRVRASVERIGSGRQLSTCVLCARQCAKFSVRRHKALHTKLFSTRCGVGASLEALLTSTRTRPPASPCPHTNTHTHARRRRRTRSYTLTCAREAPCPLAPAARPRCVDCRRVSLAFAWGTSPERQNKSPRLSAHTAHAQKIRTIQASAASACGAGDPDALFAKYADKGDPDVMGPEGAKSLFFFSSIAPTRVSRSSFFISRGRTQRNAVFHHRRRAPVRRPGPGSVRPKGKTSRPCVGSWASVLCTVGPSHLSLHPYHPAIQRDPPSLVGDRKSVV
jgi:hypothetical protein